MDKWIGINFDWNIDYREFDTEDEAVAWAIDLSRNNNEVTIYHVIKEREFWNKQER